MLALENIATHLPARPLPAASEPQQRTKTLNDTWHCWLWSFKFPFARFTLGLWCPGLRSPGGSGGMLPRALLSYQGEKAQPCSFVVVSLNNFYLSPQLMYKKHARNIKVFSFRRRSGEHLSIAITSVEVGMLFTVSLSLLQWYGIHLSPSDYNCRW